MAINFPNTPADGQVFTDPNGVKWTYNLTDNSWTSETAGPPPAPADATTSSKGIVQLADAGAVTAGTAGLVVDAAQLKAVSDADDWSRTGTTLSPKTAGDSVDLGTGSATATNLTATSLAGTGTRLVSADNTGKLIVASSGPVSYNRRPPLYFGSLFTKTSATAISIAAGAVLNGYSYATATAVTMPTHANNTDYAIWQHPSTGALVADASFTTAPAAAAGGAIVGGYHFIPAGRPTGLDQASPTGAAEILEYSLWDLTWRPSCPDPRGMACIAGGYWMDLYLTGATSYAGNTFSAVPSSRFGLTIADGSSPPLVPALFGGDGSARYADGKWYVFSEVARSFGKRLPTYDEFSGGAFGAPEATSRGTDPGTVQWERVSKFGLAQATGTLWVWGQETCTTTQPAAWTAAAETSGRGQVYGAETRAVILGGDWDSASNSGSRCAYWKLSPWNSAGNRGARLAAGHLVLG